MAKNPLFSATYKLTTQKKTHTFFCVVGIHCSGKLQVVFCVWYELNTQENPRQNLFYAKETVVLGKTELGYQGNPLGISKIETSLDYDEIPYTG